jgi:hypothetical protein
MKLQRLGRSWAARLGFSAALVASVLGVSAGPSSAINLKLPLVVVARDFQFLGVPGRLPAGTYDTRFINISREEAHEFVAVNLGPTCSSTVTSVEAGQALIENVGQQAGDGDPEPFLEAACPGASLGGGVFAEPGGRDRGDITLTPGRTLYFCGVPDEDGTPHFDLGMIGFINVFALPSGH